MNADGGAGKAPVILLVDDDAVVRFMAREALEEAGFVVVETDDGASASRCWPRSARAWSCSTSSCPVWTASPPAPRSAPVPSAPTSPS